MPDVETLDPTLKLGVDDRYFRFVWQVMSDVYALIDFLSGRARPSLASPQYRRHDGHAARRISDASGTAPLKDRSIERERTEADLEHPTTLVQRAMEIGQSLRDGSVSADDATFLVSARDLLNLRAAPVTGSSIVFTLLVISKIHPERGATSSAGSRSHFMYTNEHLEIAASKHAGFVRGALWSMFVLLLFTLALSAYVAWGKLLLDTRDAVLHDYGGNEAVLSAQVTQGASNFVGRGDLVAAACGSDNRSFAIDQACRQHEELKQRRDSVVAHVRSWDWGSDQSEAGAVQHVAVAVGVLGNYILPVLYGTLGAMGSMLRQFNRRLAERLLTPRDRRAAHIRVMLGIMTGACIGLFFNSSAGPAQATGLGGAAVTLSASAVAFLAGYGVEAVFRTLDGLINHLFGLGKEPRAASDDPHLVADRNS
jgi:hypothetical protein